MSMVDQSPPPKEAGCCDRSERSYINPETREPAYSPDEHYDDSALEHLYAMEEQDIMPAGGEKTPQATMDPPPLPQRNALRSSRLLDNLGLKLGGSIESHDQATPHDMYLSSEEDASSSADDFSDYDWDSGSEDARSPRRRRSHEDTARAVSVIFVGKPAIIELPTTRRTSSRGSGTSRPVSCIDTLSSSGSWAKRPSTSNASLTSLSASSRSSSVVGPSHALKRKPPFLNIDPFANGSTYSLKLPKETADETQPKSPITPTALLKGVTRTFSLVKKRSKPLLSSLGSTPSRDSFIAPPKMERANTVPQEAETKAVEAPMSPQSPVTYNDILRAARRNAKLASQPEVSSPQEQSPTSPLSPTGSRKSFLGGFAARRRSIKVANGRLLGGGQ